MYVPAAVDSDVVEQRIVEAAAVLPTFGGVTGWAALRWYGAAWFSGHLADGVHRRPVNLVTACDDIRSQPGIQVSAEQLYPDDIRRLDGVRLTTPERSALFEIRYAASVEQGVGFADMVMHADLASRDELVAYAAKLGTWTGIPQAREVLGLARENSWSPMETRLRLLWVLLAGLPEPSCNTPVFDLSGRHLGTPDLLDPVAGVIGEYDGAVHLSAYQRGVDVRREDAFREAGLECFSVVASDWQDEAAIARRIRSAYARAQRRAVSDRQWTIDPPRWWIRTDTVSRRRALSEHERLKLLRPRAS